MLKKVPIGIHRDPNGRRSGYKYELAGPHRNTLKGPKRALVPRVIKSNR